MKLIAENILHRLESLHKMQLKRILMCLSFLSICAVLYQSAIEFDEDRTKKNFLLQLKEL